MEYYHVVQASRTTNGRTIDDDNELDDGCRTEVATIYGLLLLPRCHLHHYRAYRAHFNPTITTIYW